MVTESKMTLWGGVLAKDNVVRHRMLSMVATTVVQGGRPWDSGRFWWLVGYRWSRTVILFVFMWDSPLLRRGECHDVTSWRIVS